MQKEEYRRALVMLRSLKSGVGGHVRLERRTLMGTLSFVMTGAGGADYQGFLLGRSGGRWRGAKLGAFSEQRGGQSGLLSQFDPRNIDGLTLEQYEIVGVAQQGSEDAQLVLFGNLNGHVDCSLPELKDAVSRLFTRTRVNAPSVMDLPERSDEAPVPQPVPEADVPEEVTSAEAAEPEPDELDAPAQGVTFAASLLGITGGWPDSIAPLKALFETSEPEPEAPLPGYVFVKAQMAADPGWCLLGLGTQQGRVDSVCYAIPAGQEGAESPAGLEEYERIVTPEGNAYWVYCKNL